MAITVNDAAKNLMVDAIADDLNSGRLRIYDAGSGVPADAGVAITDQTLLADITLPSDAFTAASGGSAAKSGTWDDQSVDATGTAAFFRLDDGAGGRIVQGSVTGTGGGGDLEIDDTSLVAGGVLTITAFALDTA